MTRSTFDLRSPMAIVALIVLLFHAALVPALAQEQAARVTLSPGSGLPESEVSLPLYLWTGGSAIRTISVALVFPGASLAFGKAELTVVSETVGAELKVEPQSPDPTSGTATVRLEIRVPEQRAPRDTLPDGPLAYLSFRIAKDTALGSDIVVKMEASGVAAEDPSRAATAIESPDAVITVQSPPVSGCFFYMH